MYWLQYKVKYNPSILNKLPSHTVSYNKKYSSNHQIPKCIQHCTTKFHLNPLDYTRHCLLTGKLFAGVVDIWIPLRKKHLTANPIGHSLLVRHVTHSLTPIPRLAMQRTKWRRKAPDPTNIPSRLSHPHQWLADCPSVRSMKKTLHTTCNIIVPPTEWLLLLHSEIFSSVWLIYSCPANTKPSLISVWLWTWCTEGSAGPPPCLVQGGGRRVCLDDGDGWA